MDDDKKLRVFIPDFLRDILDGQATVDVVCSGPEAYDYVAKHDPAVVLMDIMMPRVDGVTDGYASCKRMKDDGYKGYVVLSSVKDPDHGKLGACGADAFVHKEDRPGIERVIKEYLTKSEQSTEPETHP